MPSPLILIIFAVFLVWNAILSFLFFQFYTYYSRLVKGGKKESLVKFLDAFTSDQQEMKKTLDLLVKTCDKLEKEGLLHIQKVGLLRFNPFKDTGGDQSFILALVDANDTGVLISSLHTRSGTRWYAKNVVRGKGGDYELSKEEEQALKSAKRL
ncbi:MAG: DUF4446 family protein [Candidatus Levyibacteriota bacterium]